MNFRFSLALAVAAMGVAAFAQPEFVQGELLVKFKDNVAVDAPAIHGKIRAQRAERIDRLHIDRVKVPAGVSMAQAMAFYRAQPGVEYVEPNYIARTSFTPNDPGFASQWGPKKIQSETGWDLTKGLASVKVAILDTGVALAHPDLSAKITPGYDFINNDNIADDDHGHGTHCAGIAAASTDNGVGVAGVGFNSAIMPVKVLNSSGQGPYSAIINGIRWATDNGAKVISMSLGGGEGSLALEDAVNYAWSRGVVVVAAAGNAGVTTPEYPAFYTNVIAVAATDANDNRPSWSNYGSSWVDVAAPGVSIYSTIRTGGYGNMSGTSMATPHVAGQAALLWAHLGASTNVQTVRDRIEDFTDYVGTWVAKGRINVRRSLDGPPPANDGNKIHFAPSSFQVLKGSIVEGNLQSLVNSDENRLHVLAAAGAWPWQETELNTSATASFQGTLKQIDVTIEGQHDRDGDNVFYLYNWQSNAWDQIGLQTISTTDVTDVLTVGTNPGRYIGPGGAISLKALKRRMYSGFRVRTDQIKFTLTVEQSSSQPSTKEHAPTSYEVQLGTIVEGSLPSLVNSDNQRLHILSRDAGWPWHRIEWTADTAASFSGSLQRLDVVVESNHDRDGACAVQLYNWTTSSWEQVGQTTISTTDAVDTFTISTNPARFVGTGGAIRVRFQKQRMYSGFRMYTDQVKFVTVSQ